MTCGLSPARRSALKSYGLNPEAPSECHTFLAAHISCRSRDEALTPLVSNGLAQRFHMRYATCAYLFKINK